MKKSFNQEITQAVNRHAHRLSTMASIPIKQMIEAHVREAVKSGKPLEVILEEVNYLRLEKVELR